MWAIGLNCIVDILCSVSPDVTLLMDEFESAGGRKLFVHILAGENYVFLFNQILSMLQFSTSGRQFSLTDIH